MNHFGWGLVGGVAVSLLRLASVRSLSTAQRQALLGDWLYWVELSALALFGGFLAMAYGEANCPLPGILPLHIGASAPAILKVMGGAIRTPRGKAN